MLEFILSLLKLLLYFGSVGLVVGGILYAFTLDRPLIDHAISHWNQTIPELQGTPTEFYHRLTELINEQRMPDVEVRNVAFYEHSFLSDKRTYLRVKREGHIVDLCVAPFGKSFFISSWLCQDPQAFFQFLSRLPLFGWFFRLGLLIFDPETYYKVDAGLMFQGAVHACVLQVLDEMTAAQGLPRVPEIDRKPVMGEVYGRRRQAR